MFRFGDCGRGDGSVKFGGEELVLRLDGAARFLDLAREEFEWVSIMTSSSSMVTGKSSVSGVVHAVPCVCAETLDATVLVEVVVVVEVLSRISLCRGDFEVSTTRSSFSPRPKMPYTLTSPPKIPSTQLVPA